jgi:hypothetical protein
MKGILDRCKNGPRPTLVFGRGSLIFLSRCLWKDIVVVIESKSEDINLVEVPLL